MGRLKRAADKQAAASETGKPGGRLEKAVRSKAPDDKRWVFSFRHFRQIEFFGFAGGKGHVPATWFVSLIARLQALCNTSIDSAFTDKAWADSLRFHPIVWTQKNIPIKRTDLKWIDEIYLNNEEDYPLRQFSISTALGRVVGFFDEDTVFQVVLLDPFHNIQPSKSHDYVVNPCNPLDCELTALRASIEHVLDRANDCECQVASMVRQNLEQKTRQDLPPILLVPAPENLIEDARAAVQMDLVKDYAELLSAGIEQVSR